MHPLKLILQDSWIHDFFFKPKAGRGGHNLCADVTQRYVTSKERLRGRLTSGKRPPKMQRLSGRLQESNLTGPLPRRGRGTFTLWKIIHCMQCLSAMCSCHQCSLYILNSIVQTGTQISENASRLKSMENH